MPNKCIIFCSIKNPNLECRASDAFPILDEFSHLKSGCVGGRDLPDSVRSYEASKFGFRFVASMMYIRLV